MILSPKGPRDNICQLRPGGRGSPGREGPRDREGVCSELGNFGGGGAKFFFSGPKCPPRYINVCFWNQFPPKLHFSYKKYFSGINFPQITYHVFVCDSENYMDKRFGNYFLLISVT